jgi:hypothetical protein
VTVQVVFDAALLVDATVYAGVTWLDWPAVPPITGNHSQDALGVIASSPTYEADWALILSPTIIKQAGDALTDGVGLHPRDVAGYLKAVLQLAAASGGGIVHDPPARTRGHTPDVAAALDLALAGRRLLVTVNPAVAALGPVWGPERQSLIGAQDFAQRVDASRQARQG